MATENMGLFVVTNVFPFIGFLISSWLFTVPYREVKLARKRGNVGPVNYWVMLVMWLNSILWTIYGFSCRDYKMFFWVSPAVFTYFYFLLSILSTLSNEFPKQEMFGLEIGMVGGILALLALGAVQQLVFPDHAQVIYGSIAAVTSIIANGFPLSTTLHVISNKDSSRIHFGIGIASFTNCLFWELYAFVLKDWNVLASTSGALFLTGIQVLLCCCYERKEENDAHAENERLKQEQEAGYMPHSGDGVIKIETKEHEATHKATDDDHTLSTYNSTESLGFGGNASDEEWQLPGTVVDISNMEQVIGDIQSSPAECMSPKSRPNILQNF
jgi:hypothetical protein